MVENGKERECVFRGAMQCTRQDAGAYLDAHVIT
jgi:hypothetical protein